MQSPLAAGAGDSCYYRWTTLSGWGGMYAPAVMTPWQLLAYHIIGVVADGWCLRPFHRPQQPVLEAVVTVRRRQDGMYVPDGVDDAMGHGPWLLLVYHVVVVVADSWCWCWCWRQLLSLSDDTRVVVDVFDTEGCPGLLVLSGEWVMVVCTYLMASMRLRAMLGRPWYYRIQKRALCV